jgi:hypothetical protein
MKNFFRPIFDVDEEICPQDFQDTPRRVLQGIPTIAYVSDGRVKAGGGGWPYPDSPSVHRRNG